MVWSPQLPNGYEARKCRHRVASLCRGNGLDLSDTSEKIVKEALALGIRHGDMRLDISANDALRIFGDDYFDYVFSAAKLGEFIATEAVLREWWRVLRYGGHLIIYEPDPDYYPRTGTPGCPESRVADLYWQDVWKIVKSFGNAKLISATRHNDSNEYSWQLVIKKQFSWMKKPFEILAQVNRNGKMCFPRKKHTDKEALVIRYGALGDMCLITPVVKALKEDGYYVVVNCTEYGAQIMRENPNVDEFIIHREGTDIAYEELDDYWETIGKGFERVINLTKSIEGALVKVENSEEYDWSHEKRHETCNVNYQDRTMESAGYPEKKGCLPELYFSPMEHHLAQIFRNSQKDKFVVLWSLAGSAFHKVYPWAEYVGSSFAKNHEDCLIITVADDVAKIMEWSNQKTLNRCGVWTVRQSFIMTQYADLVIGPDTGLLNAASAYDTPKIVFMSAGSQENLTKYWHNATPLSASDCECYPCHRLIYTNSCPKGSVSGIACKCMENIKPEDVLAAMEHYYRRWKAERMCDRNKLQVCAFTIADDDLTHRLAKRTRNSFTKFHSNLPFYIFDSRDEEKIFGNSQVPSICANQNFAIRPRLASKLLAEYDVVIYLDADTVVTGRLDEFLEGDYDIAGSLNIGDEGWLNAGVCSVTNKQFCDDWTNAVYSNLNIAPSNQPSFNSLARSVKYRLKVVDEKGVYYNEQSRKYWKEIVVRDGKLFCNQRQVKVLHWAGGVSRMEEKLSSSDFNEETRQFLDAITGTDDFTKIKGTEVSKW